MLSLQATWRNEIQQPNKIKIILIGPEGDEHHDQANHR